MRQLFVTVGITFTRCTVAAAGAAPPETAGFRRVRVLDPALAQLIEDGRRDSRTLRDLVAAIEASDLIVHILVEPLNQPAVPARAALRFVVASGRVRFLRVSIPADPRSWRATVALVGHELATRWRSRHTRRSSIP